MSKQKTVPVGGTDYTLQHPGVRWYLQNTDRHKTRGGNMNSEAYIGSLLENVVIEPKVKIDDFESLGDLEKLVSEIESFLRE